MSIIFVSPVDIFVVCMYGGGGNNNLVQFFILTLTQQLQEPITEPNSFSPHLWSVPVRGRLTPKPQQACRSP
jgi:hypothetical protein